MINLSRLFAFAFALVVACAVSYFFSHAEIYWLPITALFVMQTSVGVALRQGLLLFFLMALLVMLGTLINILIEPSLPFSLLYARLYDVSLGAVIGIVINVLILPSRVDVLFRQNMIPLLNAYSNYLTAIFDLFFQKEHAKDHTRYQQKCVEMAILQYSPTWVYRTGFSVAFRQGHRHFLVMIERVEQILFSMHHIARHRFDTPFLQDFRGPFLAYLDGAKKIIFALITVLELKKLTEGISDLSDEMAAIEKEFQTAVPLSLELLDMSKDYIYCAAFIADLKDLRITLLKLAEALRNSR